MASRFAPKISNSGFGNIDFKNKSLLTFTILFSLKYLARAAGFEPATPGLESFFPCGRKTLKNPSFPRR